MHVFCTLIYGIIFFSIVYKAQFFSIEGFSKRTILFLFVAKIAAGFLIYVIYTRYYETGDIITFFEHAQRLYTLFWDDTPAFFHLVASGVEQISLFLWGNPFESTSYPGSVMIVFVNFFIRFFSFGFIGVHIIFFSFFSFCGLLLIAKSFIQKFPDKAKEITLTLFFVPSILFWTSGIQKETFVVVLIGAILFYSKILESIPPKTSQKIIFCFAFLFLFFIKNYIAFTLLVLLIANVFSYFFKIKHQLIAIFSTLLLFFCASFFLQFFFNINIPEKISERRSLAISEAQGGVFLYSDKYFIAVDFQKQKEVLILKSDSLYTIKKGSSYLQWNHNNMADTTFVTAAIDTNSEYHLLYVVEPAKSAIAMKKIKPEWTSLLKQIPESITISIFYPTPFQIKAPLYALSFFENMAVVLLIIITVFNFQTRPQNMKTIWNIITFSIIVFIIIGLTNNVVGAVVRYKTLGLVLLLPALVVICNTEKVKKQLRLFIQTKRN